MIGCNTARELEVRRIIAAQRELRTISGARRSVYGAPIVPQRPLREIEWCEHSNVPKDQCRGCRS